MLPPGLEPGCLSATDFESVVAAITPREHIILLLYYILTYFTQFFTPHDTCVTHWFVLRGGLEPPRSFDPRILSPLRMPIPPPEH